MFTHLLSPIRVGRLALPNRVLITAHATNYVDADGLPDARAVHYYAERARGGASCATTACRPASMVSRPLQQGHVTMKVAMRPRYQTTRARRPGQSARYWWRIDSSARKAPAVPS